MRALRNPFAALALSILAALSTLPHTFALGASDGASAPPAPRAKASATPAAKKADSSCKACLEKRAVLDPSLFATGFEPDVRLAYEAAKKYPDLIDRLHCFCECKESAREHHKTLLTCFTNPHAAGCGICQREAIEAAKMKAKGASDDEIEITVESLHKTDGHPPTFGRGI